ncbi:12926_t:CDS:10 [Ambispora gerdemannii]|uniref:12926_t:CDS:1 n=1 Tax=Ambispora gerdemannii TaxID=144530 RepID=A0A9N8WFR7_9GLOM|nr:12926_t:CDS:10 [Ambispora gerdemannii]
MTRLPNSKLVQFGLRGLLPKINAPSTAFLKSNETTLRLLSTNTRLLLSTSSSCTSSSWWFSRRPFGNGDSVACYSTGGTGKDNKDLPFKTYRFYPEQREDAVEKKKSAIIVLQEWWGFTEQIRLHAQRITDGTRAISIVPDIYNGKLGLSREEASHLMNNLDWKQATLDLSKLVEALRRENYTHIASIGFCMGGALNLALAAHLSITQAPLSAVITCYGVPPRTLCDISTVAVKTPVQGHFGNEDKTTGFTNSLERQLGEGIELHTTNGIGQPIEIYRYDGEGHAFLNNESWAKERRKELGFVGGENKEANGIDDVLYVIGLACLLVDLFGWNDEYVKDLSFEQDIFWFWHCRDKEIEIQHQEEQQQPEQQVIEAHELQRIKLGQRLHEANEQIRTLREAYVILEDKLETTINTKIQAANTELSDKIGLLERDLAEAKDEVELYKAKFSDAHEKAQSLEHSLTAEQRAREEEKIRYESEKREYESLKNMYEQEKNTTGDVHTKYESEKLRLDDQVRRLESEHSGLQNTMNELRAQMLAVERERDLANSQVHNYKIQYERALNEKLTADRRSQLELEKLRNDYNFLQKESAMYQRKHQNDQMNLEQLARSEEELKNLLEQHKQQLGMMEQLLSEKESQCSQQEGRIMELSRNLEEAEKLAAVAIDSPNAAGMIVLGNHGKSLPDMMREHRSMSIELIETRAKLRNIENENRRIEDSMKKMVKEILQTAPILKSRNEDSKRKSQEIDNLLRELKIKEDLLIQNSNELQTLKAQYKSLTTDYSKLQNEKEILSRHNTYFVQELESRPSVGIHTPVYTSRENDIGFRNLEEMYTQNVSMTSEINGLSRQLQELSEKTKDLESFAAENIRLRSEIDVLRIRLKVVPEQTPGGGAGTSATPNITPNVGSVPNNQEAAYYKKEAESLQARVNELMSAREELSNDCKELRQELNEAKSISSKYQVAQHQLEVYQQWLDSERERGKKQEDEHNKMLELRYTEIRDLRGQLHALQEELNPIKMDLRQRNASYTDLMETHHNLQKQNQQMISNWQKEIETVKSKEKEVTQLSTEKNQTLQELQQYKSSAEKLNEELNATVNQLKESSAERDKYSEQIRVLEKQLEESRAAHDKLTTQVEAQSGDLSKMKTQLESYESADTHLTISQLRESLTDARNQCHRLQDQIDFLEKFSQDSQRAVEELDKFNQELQEKFDQTSKELPDLKSQLEKSTNDLQLKHSELESLIAELATVREESQFTINNLKTNEEYLLKQVEQNNKELVEAKKRYDSQVLDLADTLRKLNDIEQSCNKLRSENENLNSQIESSQATFAHEKKVLEDELRQLSEKCSKLQEVNELYQRQIESNAPAESQLAIQGLRRQLEDLLRESNDFKLQNQSFKRELEEAQKLINNWKRLYEEEHQKLQTSKYGTDLAEKQIQLDQSNVHNRLLFEENQRLTKNLKELETRLEQALSDSREYASKVTTLEAEKQNLEERCRRTQKSLETEQQRYTAILASRADITPAEVEKLRKTEETVKGQLKSVTEQHKKELLTLKRQILQKQAEVYKSAKKKAEESREALKKRAQTTISAHKNEITSLKAQNETLKNENTTLKQDSESKKQEFENLKQEKDKLVKDLSDATTTNLRHNVLKSELEKKKEIIKRLQIELTQLKSKPAQQTPPTQQQSTSSPVVAATTAQHAQIPVIPAANQTPAIAPATLTHQVNVSPAPSQVVSTPSELISIPSPQPSEKIPANVTIQRGEKRPGPVKLNRSRVIQLPTIPHDNTNQGQSSSTAPTSQTTTNTVESTSTAIPEHEPVPIAVSSPMPSHNIQEPATTPAESTQAETSENTETTDRKRRRSIDDDGRANVEASHNLQQSGTTENTEGTTSESAAATTTTTGAATIQEQQPEAESNTTDDSAPPVKRMKVEGNQNE